VLQCPLLLLCARGPFSCRAVLSTRERWRSASSWMVGPKLKRVSGPRSTHFYTLVICFSTGMKKVLRFVWLSKFKNFVVLENRQALSGSLGRLWFARCQSFACW
jgi:hypothetical protein